MIDGVGGMGNCESGGRVFGGKESGGRELGLWVFSSVVSWPLGSNESLSGSIMQGISSWSGIRISGLGGSDTYQNRNMCIYE